MLEGCTKMVSSDEIRNKLEKKKLKKDSDVPEMDTMFDETEKTKKCPNCKTTNPENADFCIKCGNLLRDKKFCPNCGTENLPKSQFCQKCGKSFLNHDVSRDKEYLQVLKKQEKHSKDMKQALFVIFFIVIILPILIVLWWMFTI